MYGTRCPALVVVQARSAGRVSFAGSGANLPAVVRYTWSTRVAIEQSASVGGPSLSPVTVVNAAVSQMNGCSCGPENTGPVTGWSSRTSRALPVPGAVAVSTLRPARKPVTSPSSARPASTRRRLPVTSVPSRSTRTFATGTPAGSSRRMRASCAETTCGRDDSTVKVRPPPCATAPAAVAGKAPFVAAADGPAIAVEEARTTATTPVTDSKRVRRTNDLIGGLYVKNDLQARADPPRDHHLLEQTEIRRVENFPILMDFFFGAIRPLARRSTLKTPGLPRK